MQCQYVSKNGENCSVEKFSHDSLEAKGYCCFHLPLDVASSGGRTKAEWHLSELEQFQVTLDALTMISFLDMLPKGDSLGPLTIPNQNIDLSGAIFPKNVKITSTTQAFNLDNSFFEGTATLNVKNPQAVISICFATFMGDTLVMTTSIKSINFSNSNFKKKLNINGLSCDTFVAKDCLFGAFSFSSNCKIKELLDLSGVTFPDQSTFSNVEVLGKTIFDGVTLPDKMTISACNFGDTGSFEGLKTGDDVKFKNCHFGKKTSFLKKRNRLTEFGKRNVFSNSTFGYKSDMSDCKFGIGCSFEKGTIITNTNFSKAHFGSQTRFNGVTIHNASFNDCTFENMATFESCTFNHQTNFSGVKFIKTTEDHGPLSFLGSMFNGTTDFTGCTFSGPIAFKHGEFNEIDFTGTTFAAKADFQNRAFKGKTKFDDCHFAVAPEFHNATLHEDTSFINTNFDDTSNSSAAASYRTLRRKMEEHRSKQNQSKFYALELRSVRMSGALQGTAKFLSYLYDMFCGYGLRMGRPIAWLFGINFAFTCLYFTIGLNYKQNHFFPNFKFTMEQLVRPFYVWMGTYKPPSGLNNIWDDVAIFFQVLASFQSLISLGLLTLLILSIRRQFKMD